MKSVLLFVVLLCAVALPSGSAAVTNVASAAHKERAVAQFNQPVSLLGITLKGEYLFVHDDYAMARGESCTFVYKGNVEDPSKLVISFHCQPGMRSRVASFTVRTVLAPSGVNEVREFQFAGSSEAHVVPPMPSGSVAIAN